MLSAGEVGAVVLPREVFAGFREMVMVDEGAVAICTQHGRVLTRK